MAGWKSPMWIWMVLLVVLPATGFSRVIDLQKTGQTMCYDDSGNVIDCAGTGQDGAIQAGVSWPEQRFEDNGDGTISDHLTGLIWFKRAGFFGARTWSEALNDCNMLADDGVTLTDGSAAGDWRLPNIVELQSLAYFGGSGSRDWLLNQGFQSIESRYWSSTTDADHDYNGWLMNFAGNDAYILGHSMRASVLPVRNGTATGVAPTRQTGQTIQYATGDDGDWQAGVVWPSPRFLDRGDGSVEDLLTGLIWLKDANCNGEMAWTTALAFCSSLAQGICGLTDGSVQGDWRLPNRKEQLSLVDYSQYARALPHGHPFLNVQKPSYWSSTTDQIYPQNAWEISVHGDGMRSYPKSGTKCVWPVRGGTLKSNGELEIFTVTKPDTSDIDSPQSVGSPFEVQITARDGVGRLISSINGEISLSSSVPLSPTSVNLINGTWTGMVTLLGCGDNISIQASGYGITGQSGQFSTATIAGGNLGGIVTDNRNNPLEGAEIYLSDSFAGPAVRPPIQTDADGRYLYADIPEGAYYVWAEYSEKASLRFGCAVSGGMSSYLPSIVIHLFAGTQTPVILVPGIIGSTLKNKEGWASPRLAEAYGTLDDLELFEKMDRPGWRLLKKYLVSNKGLEEGTTIVDCPWDWRRPIKTAYKEYLIKAIKRAKNGNPNQKVNIIAHSMGGLVVRQYIQSMDYIEDIENFSMVGTPNEGSANAYYIWEGGDPLKVDNLTGDGPANTYFNTIEALYEITYKLGRLPHYGDGSHAKIRKLAVEKAPSLRQLLPVYEFLELENGSILPIATEENKNSDIVALNSDPDRLLRMGPPGATGKIKTRIYFSNTQDTIKNIPIKPSTNTKPFPYDFFSDGIPIKNPTLSPIGDGTVHYYSADLPCNDSEAWAECIVLDAKHTTLIKEYYQTIADDLYDDIAPATLSNMGTEDAEANSTPRLSISYNGRVQPYLSDPQDRAIGINPTTGIAENLVPSGSMTVEPNLGLISIDDPVEGDYTLSLKTLYDENYHISIAFMSATAEFVVDFAKFDDPGVFSISFSLQVADQTPIVLHHHPMPPSGLIADIVDQNGLQVSLSWNEDTDAAVTGYKIYGRDINEPFFKFMGSKAIPPFNTGDPWKSDSTVKKRLYAVAAIRDDGSTSFLSEPASNNDRDHDGLPDEIESAFGTLLDKADSDEDGYEDDEEILFDTNPLDSLSRPCRGNFDGDQDVDESDMTVIAAEFGKLNSGDFNGDFYRDNDVDGADLAKFALEMGRADCQ